MPRRDTVAITVVLWFLIVVVLVVGCGIFKPRRANAEPSRFYPYCGAVYHAESGLAGRTWAEIGTSYSLGRIAPSVTGSFALSDKPAVGIDFRVRIKL